MNEMTRREMISGTVLAAGALMTGCGGDPFRNERMIYRPLGKTGLDVSVIGFGGEWMERADQATCTAVTRRCEERGIGLTVMKAYAGGRLFDAKRSPFGVTLTPVQCLHYALTRPAVASVLPGYSTVEHVDDAVHYCEATAAERDYASVLAKAPRHAYAGQCTYCGHCAPCTMGIDIAMVQKLYDLAITQPTVPDSVRQHYLALKRHAGDCSSCGRCERRCPFHVKISERMRKAAELFGC